jgi:glutathione S-transferase
MKVWGRANSLNVMKVLWTLDEIGLSYERIDIGGPFGGNREPDYLARNPNGLVPTIEDGDLILWESNAITRYLAARYGSAPFLPDDVAARARADMWMDWATTTLAPSMTTLFWGWVRTPADQRDPAALEAAREKAAAVWSIADQVLAGQPFLAGDMLTIGDVPAGCFAHRWFNLPIARPDSPRLRAWYDRLRARPGYAAHVSLPMT